MILEIEEDLRDFVTISKKDYFEKKGVRLTECRPIPHFPPPLNILNGPYKQHLNTRLENQLLPENKRSEDPQDYLNKIHDKFPYLRNVLPTIDEEMIERRKDRSKKTTYQVDYSGELVDEYFRAKVDRPGKKVTLPHDWHIPETVQRYSYRDPWAIEGLVKPIKIMKPRNNLDPDLKQRKILRVITGNSEYLGSIGATAAEIMLKSLADPNAKQNTESRESSRN